MTNFSYRLVVLTHGVSSTLEACLRSFAEHVSPAPAELVIVVDGPVTDAHRLHAVNMPDFFGSYWFLPSPNGQEGFCKATARAWAEGAKPGVEFCAYLEHDFEWTRPIDLRHVASVLERHGELAQMVFCRQAVNEQEKEAGGLREARPGQFIEYETLGHKFTIQDQFVSTNPFLASTSFLRAHPWADYETNCEGLFGADLRADGWKFGMWSGLAESPLVNHIGVRDGSGYLY